MFVIECDEFNLRVVCFEIVGMEVDGLLEDVYNFVNLY